MLRSSLHFTTNWMLRPNSGDNGLGLFALLGHRA